MYRSLLVLAVIVCLSPISTPAQAAPTAEVAKKCLAYAYRVYPYKRPGSVKGTNDRRDYLNTCLAKNGNIEEPPSPRGQKPAATTQHDNQARTN